MSDPIRITGRDGLNGVLRSDPALLGDPAAQIEIEVQSGRILRVPVSNLETLDDGSYYIPVSLAELEEPNDLVIPVVQEELAVLHRKRPTGRGVRVHKKVQEREEHVDEPVWTDHVEVERVPINRVVEGPVAVRHQGDTMIVPVLEEVLVVRKETVLREEIHIRTTRTQSRDRRTVVLRRESAEIERIGETAPVPQRRAPAQALTPQRSILDKVFPPDETGRKSRRKQ